VFDLLKLLAGEEHVFCLSDANVTAKAGGIETKPEAIFARRDCHVAHSPIKARRHSQ
jgi:hypothetical protein